MKLFKKFFIQRIKSRNSGAINLIKDQKEEKIDEITKIFLSYNYNFENYKISKYLCSNEINFKLSLKSKLRNIIYQYNRFPFTNFADEIIASFASVKYTKSFSLGMPNELIFFLKKKTNLKINRFKCLIIWKIFVLINFIKGVVYGLRHILLSLNTLNKKKIKKNNSIYFDFTTKLDFFNEKNNDFFIVKNYLNLYKENSIENIYLNKSYTTIIQKKIKETSSNKILDYKNKKIFYTDDIFSPITNLFKLFLFLKYIIISSVICLFNLILNRDYEAYMFMELIKNKIIELSDDDDLFSRYIFSYLGNIDRPLWTYTVEQKRRKIEIFFFSTNGDGHNFKRYQPHDSSNWSQLQFSNYLVWDKYQKAKLDELIKNRKKDIKIIGPTLLRLEQNFNLSINKKKNIAVFDISPRKDSLMYFAVPTIIQSKYVSKFLIDIHNLSIQNNCQMILRCKIFEKTKNPLQSLNKNYVHTVTKLKSKGMIQYDRKNSNILEILKTSSCCICFPYTSIAILAQKMGIPAVYYDPSNSLQDKNFNFSHGVDVVNNFSKLSKWLSQNL